MDKVIAEFNIGATIIKELNVSFNVLLESFIGAIAIVASNINIDMEG